jgi:hypothetical protein
MALFMITFNFTAGLSREDRKIHTFLTSFSLIAHNNKGGRVPAFSENRFYLNNEVITPGY